MLDEREQRRALACAVEAGDPRLPELLGRHGVADTWRRTLAGATDPAWTARARALDLGAVLEAERRCGARFIIPGDAEWPERLGDLAFCPDLNKMGGVPVGLWVRGARSLAEAVEPSVALVGSRAASNYGARVTAELAEGLVDAGVAVVSGGAFGIDAAAHRGALAGEGLTVALLACGVDTTYPKENTTLLAGVAESGAVVSEFPPGEHPTRPRFLARNRLIAAISQATVVVEAAVRSGAKNTTSWATGCGRPVLAVPGPVTNATSYTPHQLIRAGEAILVTRVSDILEAIAPLGTVFVDRPACAQLVDTLGAAERAILEAVPSRGGRDAGELALRAGLAMGDALAAIDLLAEAGFVVRRRDGRWGLGEVTNRPLLPLASRQSESTSSASSPRG